MLATGLRDIARNPANIHDGELWNTSYWLGIPENKDPGP